MPKRAIVVLAEGFEEIEAVTAIDVLRRAGDGVTVASLGGREVEGAHGMSLQVNARISDILETPDAVVLPGGMPGSKNLGASEAVRKLTLDVHAAGGVCAAICAAPAFTLAPWGLLDKRKATCYPSFEKEFPPTVRHVETPVAVDGRVVTSRAPGTALPFALALVALLVDQATADKLRAGMLVG